MKTNSGYDAANNAYFADIYVGADEWYSIDTTEYLLNENDTITSVFWTVPAGLTEVDQQLQGNEAFIKLKGDIAGVHYIGFRLNSQESTNTQGTQLSIKIEVLDFPTVPAGA